MNKKSGGTIIVKVKKLGGAIVTTDDEQCFFMILRFRDPQWSYNYRCDANLHAIFHI